MTQNSNRTLSQSQIASMIMFKTETGVLDRKAARREIARMRNLILGQDPEAGLPEYRPCPPMLTDKPNTKR